MSNQIDIEFTIQAMTDYAEAFKGPLALAVTQDEIDALKQEKQAGLQKLKAHVEQLMQTP